MSRSFTFVLFLIIFIAYPKDASAFMIEPTNEQQKTQTKRLSIIEKKVLKFITKSQHIDSTNTEKPIKSVKVSKSITLIALGSFALFFITHSLPLFYLTIIAALAAIISGIVALTINLRKKGDKSESVSKIVLYIGLSILMMILAYRFAQKWID